MHFFKNNIHQESITKSRQSATISMIKVCMKKYSKNKIKNKKIWKTMNIIDYHFP